MSSPDKTHEQLLRDLVTLKLSRIAETYREVLDEAGRKNTPLLQTLAALVAEEATARAERALQRRLRGDGYPSQNYWPNMTSSSPRKYPSRRSCGCSTASSLTSMSAAFLSGRPELEKAIYLLHWGTLLAKKVSRYAMFASSI